MNALKALADDAIRRNKRLGRIAEIFIITDGRPLPGSVLRVDVPHGTLFLTQDELREIYNLAKGEDA